MRPRTLQVDAIIGPQKDIIFFQLCHFGFVLVKCFFHVASLFLFSLILKPKKHTKLKQATRIWVTTSYYHLV